MSHWIDDLKELKDSSQRGVLVTVVDVKGSAPRNSGSKMLVYSDGRIKGSVGGGQLEDLARKEALKHLREQSAKKLSYSLCLEAHQCCGGKVDLLFETLSPPSQVVIFGAGHVGTALAQTLSGTPFDVHLIDERSEWIDSSEIPKESHRHKMEFQKFNQNHIWEKELCYALIMTHSHDLDFEIIKALLKTPMKFLGLIGSKTKWTQFKAKLKREGFSEKEISKVHCPIGIAIGGVEGSGKTPKEIAISVSSQLLGILNGI